LKRRPFKGVLSLILAGFFLSVAMWKVTSPGIDLVTLTESSIVFYAMFLAGYYLAGPLAVACYRFHSRVRETVFLGSIGVPDFSWWAIGLTIAILNFSFLTYEMLLPFRALLIAIFPPFEAVSGFLPVSVNDALSSPQLVILVLLELNFPGPAIVCVARWLRRKTPKFGRSLFEILQLLAYASVPLIVLSWRYGPPSGMPFAFYQNLVLIFVLPTNIGGAGILLHLANANAKQRRPW
jgi:hypothetical protein